MTLLLRQLGNALLAEVVEALVKLLLAFVPLHQGIAVHPVTLSAGINAARLQGSEDLVQGRRTAFRKDRLGDLRALPVLLDHAIPEQQGLPGPPGGGHDLSREDLDFIKGNTLEGEDGAGKDRAVEPGAPGAEGLVVLGKEDPLNSKLVPHPGPGIVLPPGVVPFERPPQLGQGEPFSSK